MAPGDHRRELISGDPSDLPERGSMSLWSQGSLLSICSKGSVLSIGSVGSVLSIGSIGSAGSVLSVGSVGSGGSLLSCGSLRSVMSYAERDAVMGQRDWPRAGALAAGIAVATGAVLAWRLLREG